MLTRPSPLRSGTSSASLLVNWLTLKMSLAAPQLSLIMILAMLLRVPMVQKNDLFVDKETSMMNDPEAKEATNATIGCIMDNAVIDKIHIDPAKNVKSAAAVFSVLPCDTYAVQAGDTLIKIAAKYDITYQELAKINGVTNPNVIYVGRKSGFDLKRFI